jgi:WD40 repeat protein/serine/threonine protein kinase/class 3 adenylate cyclase
MDPPVETPGRARVEEFRRRHHTGLVTLVFTDLVDSVTLRRHLGDQAATSLLQTHRQLVRELLHGAHEAEEIETAGDSFLLLFARPSDAVKFAVVLQQQTATLAEQRNVALANRIGIHVGEVVIEEHTEGPKPKDLYGSQIDLCARVMSLAQGGQILLTRAVFDSARQALKGEELQGLHELQWLDHGPYVLKGIDEPIDICEVGVVGVGPLKPPPGSEKAQRQARVGEEPVLGWRPAVGQLVPNTKWVLEQKLGEGGFGEVWLGRHATMKERRVFKFCFRADRVRFLKREMTLFRLLKERVGDHPNIVALREVFFDTPPYFVEMDYVEGRDLRRWCDEQGGASAIPMETRLEIVAQIADALQAAHEAGVIHRDVKPANILIADSRLPNCDSEAGQLEIAKRKSQITAKLTDFGIGQVVSEEFLAGITRAGFTQTILSDSSTSHTGTQMYMAPELLAGKPASTRSDIYSLGVVLYQLVIGDLVRPLTTDWAENVSDVPLRDDLRQCFAGNPSERFAGAGQLARHLRALPERRAEVARRDGEKVALARAAYRRGVIRTATTSVVVVSLVAALAAFSFMVSRNEKAQRQRAQASEQTAQRNLYMAKMNLAQQAWEQNDIRKVRQLLQETATYPDRGFEWFYWQRQLHLELRTFRGYGSIVAGVAVSPDGLRIVAADDRAARIWDASSGQELRTLEGPVGWVSCVAFSPDGRRIVSGHGNGTAKVWDASTGTNLLTLTGHKPGGDGVRSVAFSADGRRIVTGSSDRTAMVWDTQTGTNLCTLVGHNEPLYAVAISPDGRRVVTGSGDELTEKGNGTARVWDAENGKQLLTLDEQNSIWAVAFSPDGQRVITGGSDPTVRVWDASSGRKLLELRGHSAWIGAMAFSPDGRRIVTGSWDRTAKVWDATSGEAMLTLKGHSDAIWAVAYCRDGQHLVTGSHDGTAKLWSTVADQRASFGMTHYRQVFSVPTILAATDAGPVPLRGHTGQICAVGFSPNGQRLVTGGYDGTARLWDAADGREVGRLGSGSGPINAVAFSPNRGRVATGHSDGTARVWDGTSRKELLRLVGHEADISLAGRGLLALAFSPNGQRIVTGSGDGTARIWDAASGTNLLTLRGHTAAVLSVSISSDGQRIVTGSQDKTAMVWDATKGTKLVTLRGHDGWIWAVAFSPDGRRIVTAGQDKMARVWDAVSGTNLLTFTGHGAPVRSVAYCPDGQRVLSGGDDQTAKLWDTTTATELLTLKEHEGWILAVAFSSDGRRILTGSEDRTAKLWQAATAEQVAAWDAEERAVQARLTALEGQRAAARALLAHDPGAIRQWLLLAPIAFAGQDGARALNEEQIPHEANAHPRSDDRIKVGENELAWKAVELQDYLLDFNQVLGDAKDLCVGYAVSYIESESDRTALRIKVGSDDQAKVYLNGEEIYRWELQGTQEPDRDDVLGVKLKAGVNVLVFKVVNVEGGWFGSLRFTDAAGQPVKGIKVTLTPP